MTEATTEGAVTFKDAGSGNVKTVDPRNAAIAATAGEVEPTGAFVPPPTPEQVAQHEIETGKAMQAYIDEGVRHATGHFGSAEVVSVAAFREAIGKLLEHLHLDHPENYLPK